MAASSGKVAFGSFFCKLKRHTVVKIVACCSTLMNVVKIPLSQLVLANASTGIKAFIVVDLACVQVVIVVFVVYGAPWTVAGFGKRTPLSVLVVFHGYASILRVALGKTLSKCVKIVGSQFVPFTASTGVVMGNISVNIFQVPEVGVIWGIHGETRSIAAGRESALFPILFVLERNAVVLLLAFLGAFENIVGVRGS